MLISTYEDLFDQMPSHLWEDLRNQTRSNLSIVEESDARVIKFVLVHDVHALSVVVSEQHIRVNVESANYSRISGELRRAVGISGQLPIDIRFAGQPLRDNTTLSDIGVFYPDKVFVGFDLARASGPGISRLRESDNYITSVANYMQGKPETYLQICEDILSLIAEKNSQERTAENLWRRLVLLRNLPAIVVNAGSPRLILDSISELITIISTYKENGNIQYVYNIVNALEWLAYLSPSAFDVVGRGEIVLKSLVENLSQIIKVESFPIALRMEAIWALGWAGVACPKVGPEALPFLSMVESQVELSLLRQTLRAAGLRVGYFRSAYSWASVSKEAGSFIPLIQDTSPTIGALVGTESTKLFSKALEIAAQERDLLQNLQKDQEESAAEKCELAIELYAGQPISLLLKGAVRFEARTQEVLRMDPKSISSFERRAQEILRLDEWHFQSREIGKELYRLLFLEHPELMACYQRALGRAIKESNLHLEFNSSLDLLRLPLEFLLDDSDFLALKHPMRRLFSGVYTSRPSFSPEELRKYQGGKNKLKILLVASNTGGIPEVDKEVSSLDRVLRELLASQGIAFEITTIFSNQAHIERIREELAHGKYNIFHYAGHGSFNQKPENSALYFWEDENCSGNPAPMTANELGLLLPKTALQFVYLSCCVAAEQANVAVHLDDNFMGITDALVKAGIPSVLGFRWPVSDTGALNLAKEFYKSFCLRGELDVALLDARQKVAKIDRGDAAWLSPILVVQ